MLDDDGYAEAEEEDLVCKRFVASWAPLVHGYKVRTGNFHCGILLIRMPRIGHPDRDELPKLL